MRSAYAVPVISRYARSAVLLAVLACGLGTLAATAPAASAASYEVRIVDTSAGLTLSPVRLTVVPRDEVQFANATTSLVQVDVAGGYSVVLAPGQSTGGAVGPGPYDAAGAGPHVVVATAQPSGERATGRIDVVAPSSASPAPSPSTSPVPPASEAPPSVAPPPAPESSPPSPQPSASAATASPSAEAIGGAPGGDLSPPPSPSSSPATVATGPLERPTSRSVGLPAAVAAVLIAGVVAAFLRVVVAIPLPVDAARRWS